MGTILIKNIRGIAGCHEDGPPLRGSALGNLRLISNGYIIVEDEQIADIGEMSALRHQAAQETVDAAGRFVLPAWCDSHTHLVFAASREDEFIDKIKGMSYAEIAARGGGILNSAQKIHHCSEDQLFILAWERLQELSRLGTGSIEIKSGYGLNTQDELKMLRVIARLKKKSQLNIRSTFLGAHAFPAEFRDNKEGYIKQIVEEMIPAIVNEDLADYIDVFCEQGFFSIEQTERILTAGRIAGMKAKIHANQLSSMGAVELGVKMGAVSVDHLEVMDAKAIRSLADSSTIGTMLPGAAFFLRMPFQPARQLIDAGAAIALATDFNPGSSPSGNMNLVVSFACIQMKMLPEEAINASTFNGAHAMELAKVTGSVSIGKRADLILTTNVPSLNYLPYAFGSNHISNVMIGGTWVQ